MCDAPNCKGPAAGRVLVDGVDRGVACSQRCAELVSRARPTSAALTSGSDAESNMREIFARLAVVEQRLGITRNSAAAAAAAESPSTEPIVVVTTPRMVPAFQIVEEIQRLVPDRKVTETSIHKIKRGQRVVYVVLSTFPTMPSGASVSADLRHIAEVTGVRPFLVVGNRSDLESDKWVLLNEIPRDEYTGVANFWYNPAVLSSTFSSWVIKPPSAAQIVGSA